MERPATCIDVRHAKAAMDMAFNKTDVNDTDCLVHLSEVGFVNEACVKRFDSLKARTRVAASSFRPDQYQAL